MNNDYLRDEEQIIPVTDRPIGSRWEDQMDAESAFAGGPINPSGDATYGMNPVAAVTLAILLGLVLVAVLAFTG